MTEENYLTVGELARRANVTVRTLHYYDQQGLLSPSAKGPANQRWYTEADVDRLYRVLSLKYLGLSLSEIKEAEDDYRDLQDLDRLVDSKMYEINDSFQRLLQRMNTLRTLHDAAQGEGPVDWQSIAATIESCQGDSEYFWNLTGVRNDPEPETEGDRVHRAETVGSWHELIAETIGNLTAHIPPDDPRTERLAARYADLKGNDNGTLEQGFILMENMAPAGVGGRTFEELQQTVFDYLEQAVHHHLPEEGSASEEASES